MIDVQNLTKKYGTFEALKGVSFQMCRGEVVGFLGPNGAGKTTTMRILSCYMPANSGTATVAGYDVFRSSLEVKKRVGYLPESVPLYPEMTVTGYLNYVAKIKGVPRRQRPNRLAFALESFGLTERYQQVTGQLSKGFRQRVGLAQALIHNPDVIILDEPTSGLDPRQIIEIRELITRLGQNQTIILSTHILAEASMTCKRLLVIHQGQIVGDIQLENGQPVWYQNEDTGKGRYLRLEVKGNLSVVEFILNKTDLPYTRTDQGLNNHYIFQVSLVDDLENSETIDPRPQLATELVNHHCQLLEMSLSEARLEEIFLQLTTT